MLPLAVNKTHFSGKRRRVYLHFHAMLFHASHCFLSTHEGTPVCGILSFPTPSLTSFSPYSSLSYTYVITPMCGLFVVVLPLLTPLRPVHIHKQTLIFTPHAPFPRALLSLPSSLKWCHHPGSSVTHIHTPFFIATYLRYSLWSLYSPHRSHSF